jgi:hypothetical protein
MSRDGGEVPCKDVFRYDPPKGPKNMGTGVGSHADIYNVGSQGPTPCDNDESGSPGALNTRVLDDGTQEEPG